MARNAGICHLVVVPHGFSSSPGTSYSGPRVGFSEFGTSTISGGPNNGAAWDYYFDDATPTGSGQSNSIDSCGPYALRTMGPARATSGPSCSTAPAASSTPPVSSMARTPGSDALGD